ncbi:negative elongation factor E [Lingula anatina]|uniref:Negative elongation factor E n=1 Tax=Lingula anatina TaxID=7574 RepID=A0A1S3KCZ8_LINAN|nr:negative elongation factor E-like [Lingula anatina]XP_013420372.1 negative elongation factor E [Lingula anatina]|eukprot:XP_013418807.1 negative elongation factor E-like [Lingula anatina]
MVHVNIPAALTEEEELLQKKYAKLRRKKKVLQALKAPKAEAPVPQAESLKRKQSEASAVDAKEQAKKLLKSGAIKLGPGYKDKHSFKKSRNLEKKLKDPEKLSLSYNFQPFSPTPPEEPEPSKPKVKGLYESFVSSSDKEHGRHDRESRRDRGDRPERDRDREYPKKGNTIYVYGQGITEEMLKKAFANFGTVVNINMEVEKNCGFVTFEKMESAEEAITHMNNTMVQQIQLRVSLARRQPTFEQIADPSNATWTTIAANNSQKGFHKDKRQLVSYDPEEDIF